MFRPIVLLSLVLLVVASGCVDQERKAPRLSDIFGTNVGQGNASIPDASDVNSTYIFGTDVLEGAFVDGGNTTFALVSAQVTLEQAKIEIPKQNPGPQGGGGVDRNLAVAAFNKTFTVRFHNWSRLDGFDAAWAMVAQGDNSLNFSAPSPVTAAGQSWTISEPGTYLVYARLYSGGKVQGTTAIPFRASANVVWTIDSSIHPLRAQDPSGATPQPANYEEMADEFIFTVPTKLSYFKAASQFRGERDPGEGTDVGVELVSPGGEMECVDGSAGSPTGDPRVEATEKLEKANLATGEYSVRVGAMRCDSGYYYQNAGPVPYTVTISLFFGGKPAIA